MARLSKAKQFAIYEDGDIPASDQTDEYPPPKRHCGESKDGVESFEFVTEDDGQAQPEDKPQEHDEDADDERRASAVTAASLSSLPESQYHTEHETSIPTHQPYAYPLMRPRFRRPSSVRRMQMTSPTRSPRQSALSRSRIGTPRSIRSGSVRGSPNVQRHDIDDILMEEDDGPKHHPLVLLHVTLLPIDLPWSVDSMGDILPKQTIEDIQLLRFKISETVLHRGILIPHPREEYDVLEERILQALELKEERVTKCGHFKSRDSNSTTASSNESGRDSDSGVGSSIDGSDGELCATCRNHIKGIESAAVGSGSKKWKIKVYAANGLMRSSAWAAAWAEMERIDVEILPWISDELRRSLDERKEDEEAADRAKYEFEEARVREIVEEQMQLAQIERRDRLDDAAPLRVTKRSSTTTPDIHRSSQVPLSVLLKNYIYLLAQDKRNVAIFFLAIFAFYFALILPRIGKIAAVPLQEAQSARDQASLRPNATWAHDNAALSSHKEFVANGTGTQLPEVIANASSGNDPATNEPIGQSEGAEDVRENIVQILLGDDEEGAIQD